MPNYYFGGGIQSDPMDAYRETAGMVKQSRLAKLLGGYYQNGEADLGQIAQLDPQAAQAIQKEQEQRGIAKLFGEAYAAPEDQRGGMLGQLIARGANPEAVMKLDPRYAKGGESYTLGPGMKRFGPDGKLIAEVPISDKPKYSLREFNGGLYYVPEEPMMGGQPQAQNSPAANQAFDQHIKPLMQREGGFVANDAGAGPTNFGINSRANPDVDVQNLTPDAAQQLYKQRYWDAIGGDQLPPYLQAGAFDAAVNMGVGKARELLQASGGDPAKFDQLRMQHYEGLARSNPQKYAQYLPSWRKRVQETSAMGGMQEQYQDSASGALPAGAIPVPGLPKGAPKPEPQSEFDRKIKLARELGATDEQIRNMALGTAGPPQVKPPSIQEVKDASARRLKVPQIANLDRGLKTIEQKLKDLEDNWIGTGPATGWGVGMTEEGQGLETAVGAIQNSLLALTRVPGIGSQSDLEARIANLQYPKTGNYAKNNKMLADNLRSLVADIKTAYESLADADNEILASRRGARPQAAKPSQAPNAPANGGFRILD